VVTLYAYGSNGELQTKTDSATGAQTRYQYDALGNLLTVVLPTGDSVEYLVDGQNRRVGRKLNGAVTHRWLYQNQLNPIAELDSAGALVSRFVYGSRANVPDYLVRGGAVYRLVTDHLGSVRAVVDTATGAVAQWTAYDAWGNVLADSGAGFQPFGFAGGLTDGATGLVRFGARDYDPAAGRWTAKDPVGFAARSSNLQSYVGSDPVNFLDRAGLGRAGAVIQLLTRGFRVIFRGASYDELLDAARAGDDIIAASRREAKELAEEYGGGRLPVGPERGRNPGDRWHFHAHDRAGPHFFFSAAPLLTLSHYAQGSSCLVRLLAGIGDMLNPLSVGQDIIDVVDMFE
jgi:RHS repeat-associated protein